MPRLDNCPYHSDIPKIAKSFAPNPPRRAGNFNPSLLVDMSLPRPSPATESPIASALSYGTSLTSIVPVFVYMKFGASPLPDFETRGNRGRGCSVWLELTPIPQSIASRVRTVSEHNFGAGRVVLKFVLLGGVLLGEVEKVETSDVVENICRLYPTIAVCLGEPAYSRSLSPSSYLSPKSSLRFLRCCYKHTRNLHLPFVECA